MPDMTLMMVDFPEPFSPARQWISPGRIASDTPSSARTPPKRLLMFFSSMRYSDMTFRRAENSPALAGEAKGRRQLPPAPAVRSGSEVVLVHVVGRHTDPACAIEQVRTAGVRGGQGLVADEAEVETFL